MEQAEPLLYVQSTLDHDSVFFCPLDKIEIPVFVENTKMGFFFSGFRGNTKPELFFSGFRRKYEDGAFLHAIFKKHYKNNMDSLQSVFLCYILTLYAGKVRMRREYGTV